MIRSTKCSLKFANKEKLIELHDFISEYKNVCDFFIKEFWGYENIQVLIPKKITQKANTWLSARAVQCASKQASGIVRGTRKKQKQREWMYDKLIKEGDIVNANKLLKVIEDNKTTIPSSDTINPELDSRFISIDKDSKTSFDIWITISSIGQRKKIKLPIKKTKHFNKLDNIGELKSGLRIGKSNITFAFEIKEPAIKTSGKSIGLDMGVTNVFCCSNGIMSKKDIHGHNVSSIQDKLSRKQKGSKGFKKVQEHRKNFINWSINQLNLNDVKTLNIENLKNVRKGKKTSRKLSHWTYTEIKDKIMARCEENGVRLVLKPYAYSSQRCSKCGWTQKANRSGKLFKCKNCEFTCDSDINAAVNISLNLPEISWEKLRNRDNLNGFFYIEQERIVPVGQKL